MRKRPVSSVEAIHYHDLNGDQQEWDAEDYQVDLVRSPARVMPVPGTSYPVEQRRLSSVVIDFIAGFASVDLVHESAREAICLLVGHWFYSPNRGMGAPGIPPEVSGRFDALMYDLKGI